MGTASLLAGALIAVAASAAFFAVAAELRRRRVSAGSRVALDLLRGWWLAVGAFGLLWAGVVDVMAAAGLEDVRLYVMVRSVAMLILLAGLWSLTAHFSYLFTGSDRFFLPLGAFYALAYGLVAFTFASATPVGISATDWLVDIRYDPGPDPRLVLVILVIVGLPQVLAAGAYLLVARRVSDPAARMRARLVSAALVIWFASLLLANLLADDTLRFLSRPILGFAAAAVVYFAYRPPVWFSRRVTQEAPP